MPRDTAPRMTVEDLRRQAEEERAQIMDTLRHALYTEDMDWLSIYTGRSTSCLYAIRRGKTKWPRPETIFVVARALGPS